MLETRPNSVRFTTKPITLERIQQVSLQANLVLETAREAMLEPHPRKSAPVFTGHQVAQLCGIEKKKLNYMVSRPNSTLPTGSIDAGGRSTRVFSLAEAQEWVRQVSSIYSPRPPGTKAFVISCSNLKGGSTKTTSALHLAQGLTLRGRKVLLVDLDGQCSLTNLMDMFPEKDVFDNNTIIPFFDAQQPDLSYAVLPTYWSGIDLIPATYAISGIDVTLPIEAAKDMEFDFWALLDEGLEPLRDQYDVIILDTPPSMSYLTFNAIYAANGIVMPLPPESLDFASSAKFWNFFSELFRIANARCERNNQPPLDKAFDFINVLLSKVRTRQNSTSDSDRIRGSSTAVARSWIMAAYDEMVLPVEIPMTEIAAGKATEFGSIYDISQYQGDRRTYQKVREACDRFVEIVDEQIMTAWNAWRNDE